MHEDYTLPACLQYAITHMHALELMKTQVQGYPHAQSSGDSPAIETAKHLKVSRLSRLGHHHIHSFQVMSLKAGLVLQGFVFCVV